MGSRLGEFRGEGDSVPVEILEVRLSWKFIQTGHPSRRRGGHRFTPQFKRVLLTEEQAREIRADPKLRTRSPFVVKSHAGLRDEPRDANYYPCGCLRSERHTCWLGRTMCL